MSERCLWEKPQIDQEVIELYEMRRKEGNTTSALQALESNPELLEAVMWHAVHATEVTDKSAKPIAETHPLSEAVYK